MTQLRTIQKQICACKNPSMRSVLISDFRSVLHSTIYSAPMYCLMFVVLVGHSRIASFYLLWIDYHMQLLDLQGAMGTKKTIKSVKHQWRLVYTKRTMRDYQNHWRLSPNGSNSRSWPCRGLGRAGWGRAYTYVEAQTCQGLPEPARACRGLPRPAKACQGRPGPATVYKIPRSYRN